MNREKKTQYPAKELVKKDNQLIITTISKYDTGITIKNEKETK